MNTVDETVNMLLQQLKDHPECNYISVRDLINDAGMDIDQIEFMDLFHIQKRMEAEAMKAGIKLHSAAIHSTIHAMRWPMPIGCTFPALENSM